MGDRVACSSDSHFLTKPSFYAVTNIVKGMFDDIIADGVAQPVTRAALLYSESADTRWSSIYTPGAAKRALHITLAHAQIPADALSEEDVVAGALNHYSVLYAPRF